MLVPGQNWYKIFRGMGRGSIVEQVSNSLQVCIWSRIAIGVYVNSTAQKKLESCDCEFDLPKGGHSLPVLCGWCQETAVQNMGGCG